MSQTVCPTCGGAAIRVELIRRPIERPAYHYTPDTRGVIRDAVEALSDEDVVAIVYGANTTQFYPQSPAAIRAALVEVLTKARTP